MTLNESSSGSALDVKIKEEQDPLTLAVKIKEEPGSTTKTSTEILSELFSVFNAEPPVIQNPVLSKEIKSEKHGKHKKKSKHKDKKKKKKLHKSGRSSSDESSENEAAFKRKHKKSKKSSHKCSDTRSNSKNLENNLNCNEIVNNKQNEISASEKDLLNATIPKEVDVSNSKRDDSGVNSTVTNKITIKNLKFSTVFETNVRIAEEQARMKSDQYEDGELSETNDQDNNRDSETDGVSDSKYKSRYRHGSKSKHESYSEFHKIRHKSRHHSKSRTRDHNRSKSRSRSRNRKRSWSRERKTKDKSTRSSYRHMESHTSSSKYQDSRSEKKHTNYKDVYRSKTRSRTRSRSPGRARTSASHLDIDKKRLLAIARKNAIHMLKSGTLPGAAGLCKQAQEKVMAAIKSGGKSIEELTDFCKNLSQNEALGELSSVSSGESDHEEDGSDKLFHHPFVIKDRGAIVLNIKNAVQIPTKTLQEKTAEQVKSLRMLFPVSSGTHHRKTENEWVPVSPPQTTVPTASKPKKEVTPFTPSIVSNEKPAANLNIQQTQSVVAPMPMPSMPIVPNQFNQVSIPTSNQVFNTEQPTNLDISTIISQRLVAMRRLQENPTDVNAMTDMYHAQRDMSVWASSKYEPGQFTGSTGANILSARELQSGTQAWAKRDQLQRAAPVSGGMGMHLLQKMGWRPGEGLGKDKSGSLQPLMLEVKLDKKGLVANEEAPQRNGKSNIKKTPVYTLAGKHPVSLLGEYASKRKLGAPCYELCFESGPDHKKNFLFKVKLNGIEYQPSIANVNKKQAKADAATVCLQKLGLLPAT